MLATGAQVAATGLQHIATSQPAVGGITAAMAAASGEGGSSAPEDFRYTHLWASADGETHLQSCTAKDFESKGYSGSPQWVLGLGKRFTPTSLTLTQVDPGWDNPWHPCPAPQFVVTLSGSWFLRTSDGSEVRFKAGDVLWQDNTKDCPSAKPAQHCSGTVGDEPCRQLLVQVGGWTPEVDKPGPF